MRRIIAGNPILDPTYLSYLSENYVSGTDLTVVSTVSYASNDFLVVGKPNEEKTELKQMSTKTGATLISLASALNFTHPAGTTPIYKSFWDQVEFQANTGSGFSVLSLSAVQWDNPQGVTVYYHQAGGDSTEYRYRFYNSSLDTYSEFSPTVTGARLARNVVNYMVSQVRTVINDPTGRVLTTDEMIRDFNDAQDIIYATKPKWWFLKFNDTSITVSASTARYNLDLLGGGTAGYPGTVLGAIDRIKYHLNDGTSDRTYRLVYKPPIEFDSLTVDNLRSTDDDVIYYTTEPPDSSSINGYLRIEPVPASSNVGTLDFWGYKMMTPLVDVADATEVPLPSLLENYAIAKGYRVLGNETKAAIYEELFYGPAPSKEKFSKLTGIPLLENLNAAQTRPAGQPRALWNYRGRRGTRVSQFVDRDRFVEDRFLRTD